MLRSKIYQSGDAILRKVSQKVCVQQLKSDRVEKCIDKLDEALSEFRELKGFGRGIAANQVGYDLRILMLNLGCERGNFPVINPTITRRSKDLMTLFDDCMSIDFGNTMVRVERHESVDVNYLNQEGQVCTMTNLNKSVSELLQHEIDHLDGVLMFDRVKVHEKTGISMVNRGEFESRRDFFTSIVDYTIEPTL